MVKAIGGFLILTLVLFVKSVGRYKDKVVAGFWWVYALPLQQTIAPIKARGFRLCLSR